MAKVSDLERADVEGGWRLWLIRGTALLTIAYTAYYLGWRWTDTLNPDALWFAVPLAAAETWGLLTFIFLVVTAWRLKRRPVRPAPEGLDVAVFITTYDEPLPVIRKTAVAARRIRYPHTTYILDDGCREEVAALARDTGIHYLERESDEHAKAGNLNHALGLTDEEFILQLDADHVPLPEILHRLLGHFDEDVAFVQSPQDFYNLDSFTHVVDEEGRRMWEEQRIFFDIIQPGKDRWNSAFFCGSCGVIRRAALDEIGGFSTETITEDVETSLRLHALGWKSAYVSESLAYGLSPGSAAAYQVQRLRWGQGSMQILRKFNPLTYPGLDWRQRLSYLISLTHYFDGYQKLVFLAAPFVYFFTGILPIRALDLDFLVRFFPYLFLTILSFEMLTRGRGYLWLAERYNMAKWPVYLRAVWGLFTSKRLKFDVTPKGDDDQVPVRVYLPQLTILVLSPVALLWATVAFEAGWMDYGAPGWRSAAFVLNALWLGWNGWFAWEVVKASRRLLGSEDYSFREEIPLRLHRTDHSGLDIRPGVGVTREISPRAIRLLTATQLGEGDRLRLDMALTSGRADIPGRVRTIRRLKRAGVTLHEVTCDVDPSIEDTLAIELHCVHHTVPLRSRLITRRPDLFEDFFRWIRERRGEARNRVGFPAQIGHVGGERTHLTWHGGSLEELSPRGALLLIHRPVDEGDWIRFQVPGAEISGQGVVRHVASLVTSMGTRWVVGLERLDGTGEEEHRTEEAG